MFEKTYNTCCSIFGIIDTWMEPAFKLKATAFHQQMHVVYCILSFYNCLRICPIQLWEWFITLFLGRLFFLTDLFDFSLSFPIFGLFLNFLIDLILFFTFFKVFSLFLLLFLAVVLVCLSQIKICRENLLKIYPAFKVRWNIKILKFWFTLDVSAIEITTRQENKFSCKHAFFLKIIVYLSHCSLNLNTIIDLLLSDPCQFCTEFCKLGINCWFDINLEGTFDTFIFHVDNDDWKLNNFFGLQDIFLLCTSAFKIIYTNVFDWCFVYESFCFEI